MKAIKRTIVGLAVGCVLALSLSTNLHAESYWSTKDPDLPPLPFNKYPNLPVVEIEPGKFLVDDTSIPDTPEQAESRKARQEAAQRAAAIASDPVLAEAARQAAAEAARKREEQWQQRLQAAQPILRSWGWPGDAETQQTREEAQTELQALAQKAEEARANAPQVEATLV